MATQLRVISSPHRVPIEELLQNLTDAQERLPQQVSKLRQQVATFERMYSMSSAEMRTAVEHGQLPETDDICTWLMKLQLLDDVAPAT